MKISTIDPARLLEVTGGQDQEEPLNSALIRCKARGYEEYPVRRELPDVGASNDRMRDAWAKQCDAQFINAAFPIWRGQANKS